jgi:hypothetical protein
MIYTLLLLMVAASADCIVYIWKDKAGTVHFTNKEYEIPPRYRSRVKVLYPEQADQSFGQPVSTVLQTPALTPPPDTTIQPKTMNPSATPQKERRRQRGSSSEED